MLPTMTVTKQGEDLTINTLIALDAGTHYKMGLYTARTAGAYRPLTLGDLTEVGGGIGYSRQDLVTWSAAADDGLVPPREYRTAAAVTFGPLTTTTSVLGRFILSPDGNLFALQDFPAAIPMGVGLPALQVTVTLEDRGEAP